LVLGLSAALFFLPGQNLEWAALLWVGLPTGGLLLGAAIEICSLRLYHRRRKKKRL
jgi:hypothetical protein